MAACLAIRHWQSSVLDINFGHSRVSRVRLASKSYPGFGLFNFDVTGFRMPTVLLT